MLPLLQASGDSRKFYRAPARGPSDKQRSKTRDKSTQDKSRQDQSVTKAFLRRILR